MLNWLFSHLHLGQTQILRRFSSKRERSLSLPDEQIILYFFISFLTELKSRLWWSVLFYTRWCDDCRQVPKWKLLYLFKFYAETRMSFSLCCVLCVKIEMLLTTSPQSSSWWNKNILKYFRFCFVCFVCCLCISNIPILFIYF